MLVTDELAPRCSHSARSEELEGTEFQSQLLQVTDSDLVHDNVSPPGRSNTKKLSIGKTTCCWPILPAVPEHSRNPSVI